MFEIQLSGGKEVLFHSICQFLWYEYFYNGHFKSANMMSNGLRISKHLTISSNMAPDPEEAAGKSIPIFSPIMSHDESQMKRLEIKNKT